MSRKGFNLVEILFATIFIMLAFLLFMVLFTTSNRGTVDSYQETIAHLIAVETMEWTGSLGNEVLARIVKGSLTPEYIGIRNRLETIGLGRIQDVKDFPIEDGSMVRYPEDYKRFERSIELSIPRNSDLVQVRVTVQGKYSGLFKKNAIVLEKLVAP